MSNNTDPVFKYHMLPAFNVRVTCSQLERTYVLKSQATFCTFCSVLRIRFPVNAPYALLSLDNRGRTMRGLPRHRGIFTTIESCLSFDGSWPVVILLNTEETQWTDIIIIVRHTIDCL